MTASRGPYPTPSPSGPTRTPWVLDLTAVEPTQRALVGGKGASLAELSRLAGLRVPPGFCVTTAAFARVLAAAEIDDRLARLSSQRPDDREEVAPLADAIRRALAATPVPDELAAAIAAAVARHGADTSWAVRSSATAEDLPTASFAGQHDSYLEVVGTSAVLAHVRRCWASLFSARAIAYRADNGFDHRRVQMAVVVQRMVRAQAAGVLFTADPVSGNRRVSSIEACPGLGEDLVAGRVAADGYQVRDGEVVARTLAAQHPGVPGAGGDRGPHPETAGGEGAPVLSDLQIVRLAALGRRIEEHFGRPQDVEWCLLDDDFAIVQSRPITTLFPIPAAPDAAPRVYLSVGHQQMMTDAMRPLGLSFWQLTTRAPMAEAGGRLFVDVTRALASPTGRQGLFALAGKSDPLVGDALRMVVERSDFLPPLSVDAAPVAGEAREQDPAGALRAAGAAAPDADPAIVAALVERTEASLAALRRDIEGLQGTALLDFIRGDFATLRDLLFDPQSLQVIMAAIEATWWLNDQLHVWLGERNAADALTQSAPGNVTSEMGLALLDVADAVRPHPQVVAFLARVGHDDSFLATLPALPGGRQAAEAIQGWLDRYGMRCVGEIDVTRPRFAERPSALLPALLGNVRSFAPGEAARRFAAGREQAASKEREVLARLRALPDGDAKAAETKRRIDRVRTFIGYREYPKYGKVRRYFVYKQALLREASRLVAAGVLAAAEDLFYLRWEEIEQAVRTQRADRQLIARRREDFRAYQALTPPRVLTSEGESIVGAYHREDLPPGALSGLAVSAGTVEGRARVLLDLAAADLAPGDILVTRFTDPSWTPLFVVIRGLVTEVGGLMTHGAVIAREYGLPAVVGVEGATRRIRDGQRIRVHGGEGYVEFLD